MQPMQPPLLANELNPEVILAAQIVLGLFVLIIMLLLSFPRFQQVELVLELIEALGTLVSIVVLLLQIIHDLHEIISMAHEGFQQVVLVLELTGNVVGSLVNLVVLLLRLIRICRRIWSILTARQPVVVPMTTRMKSHLLILTMARMISHFTVIEVSCYAFV